MAYRFLKSDTSVESAVRRIAGEQIDKALVSLDATGDARAGAIHDVRKRCKKLRGLLRLVRHSFPDYPQENAAFRDISRLLGAARDAKVLEETYDAVLADYNGTLERAALDPVRAALTRGHEHAIGEADLDAGFAEARTMMQAARERAEHWTLGGSGLDEGWVVLGRGVAATYRRARKAMAHAAKKPDAERQHEWRKRVKYHWYHARLLRSIWPEQMEQRADLAKQLAELLGDHHDCHVLEETLAAAPETYGSAEAVATIVALARRRRALLEEQAHRLGARLQADKTRALVERWGEWWKAWVREDDLPPSALGR